MVYTYVKTDQLVHITFVHFRVLKCNLIKRKKGDNGRKEIKTLSVLRKFAARGSEQ